MRLHLVPRRDEQVVVLVWIDLRQLHLFVHLLVPDGLDLRLLVDVEDGDLQLAGDHRLHRRRAGEVDGVDVLNRQVALAQHRLQRRVSRATDRVDSDRLPLQRRTRLEGRIDRADEPVDDVHALDPHERRPLRHQRQRRGRRRPRSVDLAGVHRTQRVSASDEPLQRHVRVVLRVEAVVLRDVRPDGEEDGRDARQSDREIRAGRGVSTSDPRRRGRGRGRRRQQRDRRSGEPTDCGHTLDVNLLHCASPFNQRSHRDTDDTARSTTS